MIDERIDGQNSEIDFTKDSNELNKKFYDIFPKLKALIFMNKTQLY